MIETAVWPLVDGEELGQTFVDERGSRLLYADPRERTLEARRQAGDQVPPEEAHHN